MASDAYSIGVVMDPIDTIQPAKDSTLAMMLAAQARGHRLVYLQQSGLSVRDGKGQGGGHFVNVTDDSERWFQLGEPWNGPLGELDVILMRKDPPFNTEYIHTTYILELAEKAGSFVVNKPSSLRNINEKVYTAWFPQCTPPSLISRSHDTIKSFLAEHNKIVVKPLDGMGGRSIFIVEADDLNANVILETLTADGTRYALAQKFIPEIDAGDKRILLVDGQPVPYALARVPAKGEFRGNLVMGATGVGQDLSDQDLWICSQVAPKLKEQGVVFAGLDVIGDYLTEINVTSPTGIRELDRQFGLNIADMLMEAVELRLGQ